VKVMLPYRGGRAACSGCSVTTKSIAFKYVMASDTGTPDF
jgi:hypothetical protein